MKSLLLALAIMARYASCVLAADATPKGDLPARVDAIAAEALDSGIVGLSVAVISKGQPVVVKGYGFANLEHKVLATADTVYHICSVTKNFTAGAILKLIEQGKLELDTDITSVIPQFASDGRKITVRQLLNHTSGIRSYTELGPIFDSKEKLDLSHDEVLALLQGAPPDFAPGTHWHYSNSGFFLLGLIIEAASGQAYSDFLQQQIVEPLKLDHTCLCDNEPIIPSRSQSYLIARGKPRNADYISWRPVFSAGAICSTVMDLARWQQALDAGQVVKPELLALMREPTNIPGAPPLDYALGTRLGSLEGHRCVGHTGSGAGFNALLQRFPDDDLTIVVLTNTEGARIGASSIAAKIARAALGLPAVPLTSRPVPSADQAAVAGEYPSENGVIALAANGDVMVAKPRGASGPGLALTYLGDRTFAAGAPDHRIKFFVQPDGSVWAIETSAGLFVSASKRIP